MFEVQRSRFVFNWFRLRRAELLSVKTFAVCADFSERGSAEPQQLATQNKSRVARDQVCRRTCRGSQTRAPLRFRLRRAGSVSGEILARRAHFWERGCAGHQPQRVETAQDSGFTATLCAIPARCVWSFGHSRAPSLPASPGWEFCGRDTSGPRRGQIFLERLSAKQAGGIDSALTPAALAVANRSIHLCRSMRDADCPSSALLRSAEFIPLRP